MYKHHFLAAAALAAVFISAGIGATGQPALGPWDDDPFADIDCPVIAFAEAEALDGGDVFITLNQQRNKLTVYATDNRYAAGGRVDTLKQAYTVEAHNNIAKTVSAPFCPTEKSKRELANMENVTTVPGPFPAGTWEITGTYPPSNPKYGPNMIMTNAVGRVDVVKTDDKRNVIVNYGMHEDKDYAIHSNTEPMSSSKSYGCIVVSQEDNAKITKTIKTDKSRSPSQKQSLTVLPKSSTKAVTSAKAKR